jgi:hypothetical protein
MGLGVSYSKGGRKIKSWPTDSGIVAPVTVFVRRCIIIEAKIHRVTFPGLIIFIALNVLYFIINFINKVIILFISLLR